MSRIGKQKIIVPEKVEAEVHSIAGGSEVNIKGPLGLLSRTFRDTVAIEKNDNIFTFTPCGESKLHRSSWGTYAAHVKNMIIGVTEGYVKKLLIEGIGYRAEVEGGKTLVMSLGFSHPVRIPIPEGIKVLVEKSLMAISGFDKELVGSFAAKIVALKKPEPYKGKGIRYEGQVIIRKQGKKAVG